MNVKIKYGFDKLTLNEAMLLKGLIGTTALMGLCGCDVYWHGMSMYPGCDLSVNGRYLHICIECLTQSCEEMYDKQTI